MLSAVALLALLFALLAAMRGCSKAARHAIRTLYYAVDPKFLGR